MANTSMFRYSSLYAIVFFVAGMQKMLDNVPSQQLPDICVSIVKASLAEKVQVLDAVDLAERFKKTLPLLMRQIEVRNLLNTCRSYLAHCPALGFHERFYPSPLPGLVMQTATPLGSIQPHFNLCKYICFTTFL